MAVVKHNKIKLREVNRHLVCRLCRGYYIDATTIAECLHSFCRSCIIKYLEKNSFCPVCEVQIHKTKPYLNLRLDKALQDVVYKLVPGLYHDEMKRRRDFYAVHQEQIPLTAPEQCGLEERIIFSPDDSISLSLEYLESDDFENETVSSQSSESGDVGEGLSFPQQLGLMKLKNADGKSTRRESQDVQETSSFPKRYLQCPAVVSVHHLKKFIRMKHDLTDKMQVDIVHKRVPLPDHYTLMDVAYIFTWKRSSPMRFFYQICETRKHRVKVLNGFAKEEEAKIQLVNGESNPEVPTEGKHINGEIESKVEIGADKGAIDVKSEIIGVDKTLPGEDKQQTVEDSLKSPANNRPKLMPVDKSENVKIIKEGNGDEMKNKVLENCEKDNKSDSSESGVKEIGVKSKSENEKMKNGNQVNGNGYGIKAECAKSLENNERLLLNPISGKLESVPSANKTKPVTNGVTLQEPRIDNFSEVVKKEVADHKSKKSHVDDQKDVKKSCVNQLKSFRKEKLLTGKESKGDAKSNSENALTITSATKMDKPVEKEKADVSIEIKADKKGSEYDFDGTSPPSKIVPLQEYSKMAKSQKYGASAADKQAQNSWMSLQDFRMHMLKENNSAYDESGKKDKRKSVPSLFRIGSDATKKTAPKTPSGKIAVDKVKPRKMSPTIINIKTEDENNSKTEIKIELPEDDDACPPKPIKIENKGGEYSIKQKDDEAQKSISTDAKKSDDAKVKFEGNPAGDSSKEPIKRKNPESPDSDSSKKSKPSVDESKNDHFGAIDLTKTDASPKNVKSDENMVEALISAAQKQSIEPLLKIPHYSQNQKSLTCQNSPPLSKNISSNDISEALQFFKDLRSDIKVLEAKSQFSATSFLEQFSQKSPNLEHIQLYQQHIDLIRRLKRQQMLSACEPDSPSRKLAKYSPTSETKKKVSPDSKAKVPQRPDEAAQFKSSLERTLSQIQEQMEIQSRMVAAQNYKNLPALLQFYNRPPVFCPGPPSPTKSSQNKVKSSSHSPNSQKSPNSRKSPPNLSSSSGTLPLTIGKTEASYFTAQNYNHFINAGLNSEMTFHQMFQNYLKQQDKMNQFKNSQAMAYYGSQAPVKKQEQNSVTAVQKT